MKRIIAATDFSPRSDRAIRRATLLAKQFAAKLVLVHVIDDDRSERLVEAERDAAYHILQDTVLSLRTVDGIACDSRVIGGDISEAILAASEETRADLIVLGVPRGGLVRALFGGTTAERTVRSSKTPILATRSTPSSDYKHIMVAVDLSACSVQVMQAIEKLGLAKARAVTLFHAFDAPATSLMARASLTLAQMRDYIADVEQHSKLEVRRFLEDAAFRPNRLVLRLNEGSTAMLLLDVAQEIGADLVVIGTHGRSRLARLALGSVARDTLGMAKIDVLVVPETPVAARQGAAAEVARSSGESA